MFYDENIFRSNEDKQFCGLGNVDQVVTLKIVGRGMVVSEFVCTCHSKMIDTDTGKPVT